MKNIKSQFILIVACFMTSSLTANTFAPAHHSVIFKNELQTIKGAPNTLTKKEVLDKIKKIVSKELNVKTENIKMQSNFVADLGADDLDLVELVMAFEDEFNITIPDKDAETLTTVQKTFDYLVKKLKIRN